MELRMCAHLGYRLKSRHRLVHSHRGYQHKFAAITANVVSQRRRKTARFRAKQPMIQ